MSHACRIICLQIEIGTNINIDTRFNALFFHLKCGELMSHKWVSAVWEIIGVLTFLSGYISGNIVTMVVGVVVAFGYTSSYLTSYIRSAHIIKRALEVIFMLSALGVVIYGYAITGSPILGVMTIFIVTVVLFGFIASYLLPRIRSKSSERDVV